jgi:ketosteroid isomerase-like protein
MTPIFITKMKWLLVLPALLLFAGSAPAQDAARASATREIPLRRCDRLLLIEVTAANKRFHFLVDTGATSMLEVKSFPGGDSKGIEVASWNGPVLTSARAVTLDELRIGSAVLRNLRLPAIDLSPIGRACGQRVDGIFGVDLMERSGLTLDLKRRVALLPAQPNAELEELHRNAEECVLAFNRRDTTAFAKCVDPEIQWYTPWGEFHGRQPLLTYLKDRFFTAHTRLKFEFVTHTFHQMGDAYWCEYEYKMTLDGRDYRARGTSVSRKNDGRWQMVSVHHSLIGPVPQP